MVVVLDCTPWAYTDAMGVEAVKEMSEELRLMGIRLFFASLRGAVRIQYKKAGLFDVMDEDQVGLHLAQTVDLVLSFDPRCSFCCKCYDKVCQEDRDDTQLKRVLLI